ncbi:hypothetical protein, partial [uncultured Cytophaga sp.]|uniref:hypothetical protein n=1 Tax=uncultured Cytophaga sp. TaxID=160238 RepID=UPI002614A788
MRCFFIGIICIFLGVLSIQVDGQTTTEYKKKWLFGMNWGGAWENADVHSRLGTGWGLTLEKEIIADNTSTFGFSLRGRYLHTWMWGREMTPYFGVNNDNNLNGIANPSINYTSNGFVYRNFFTKTDEFSLEGLLILNRLRAHSGFKIYGFGGIGATGYVSKINQLDDRGTMYNYSSVSTSARSLTRSDLNTLWDKSYETNGVAGQSRNSYVLSGAIGIGIGIKLSPNVYLGWEHKYTYTSTDHLDASIYRNNGAKSIKNDRYHYSGLFLTVAIGSGSAHVENPPDNRTYYPTATPIQKPVITLLSPRQNPVQLTDCYASIKVSITNISSVNQISVLIDGNTLPSNYYTFNAVTQIVEINAAISGNSVFSIIAQNNSGKDTKYVYTNCYPVLTPSRSKVPEISIVNTSSNNCIAYVVASIKNVSDPKNVVVIMDGEVLNSRQYTYNPNSETLVINKPFNQRSLIIIRAVSNGFATEQKVNLSCSPANTPKTILIPVIKITKSEIATSSTNACVSDITATIVGIENINMITITRNGALLNASNYIFDTNNNLLTITEPIVGMNTYLIQASNAVGTATATVALECIDKQITLSPTIVLIQPTTSIYSSTSCNEHLILKIAGINTIEQIHVLVDGVPLNEKKMQFDRSTALLTFNSVVVSKTNIIISASNDGGTAVEKIVITCNPLSDPSIDSTEIVKEEQVIICHQSIDGSGIAQTISIPKSTLAVHLSHGDHVGSCINGDDTPIDVPVSPPVDPVPPTPEQTIVICHKKSDGTVATITIVKSQLAMHLNHGDHVGACTQADVPVKPVDPVPPTPEQTIVICHKKSDGTIATITIVKSQL